MLKFTYTEAGFHLEHLTQSLEEWFATRMVFALRMGQKLAIDHCSSSLLIPVDLADTYALKSLVQQSNNLTLSVCDADYVEVSLYGTWISSAEQESEGIFVTALPHRIEFVLHKLWQESQVRMSTVR